MGLRAVSALIGLFLATACVTVSVGPITTPPARDASHVVSQGKGFGLVPDNNGQVVTVDADTDLIRLALDDGWAWSVHVDPAFLQLQQYRPVQGQGFTAQIWLYKLMRTGETEVRAIGTPNCRSGASPCADSDRLYSVRLRTR